MIQIDCITKCLKCMDKIQNFCSFQKLSRHTGVRTLKLCVQTKDYDANFKALASWIIADRGLYRYENNVTLSKVKIEQNVE